MPRGTERPIRTNQEVSNPPRSKEAPAQNPLGILKERFSFLPPLEIKSADLHKEKRQEYWEQYEKFHKQAEEPTVGSKERQKILLNLGNKMRSLYHAEDYLMQSASSSDKYGIDMNRANALRHREWANRYGYLAEAEGLEAGSDDRKKIEASSKSAEHIVRALDYTIKQVQMLVEAERFKVGSDGRKKMEEVAQNLDSMAKRELKTNEYFSAREQLDDQEWVELQEDPDWDNIKSSELTK